MADIHLVYASRRGASIIRSMPHDKEKIVTAMANLCKRKIAARLVCAGQTIGCVYYQSTDRRWAWQFDLA